MVAGFGAPFPAGRSNASNDVCKYGTSRALSCLDDDGSVYEMNSKTTRYSQIDKIDVCPNIN